MFLSIDSIHKAYGSQNVLTDITFDISEGEMVSIIGPSGAGKTTLLKIIAGLEQPDSGSIYSSADLKRNPAILVFQDYILFPTMNVFENVTFGLKCRKTEGQQMKQKALEMLNYFQLADKVQHYPNQLSAGQQQRVALARAMVINPSLLLLDEPFANLDRNLKSETAEFIRNFQKEYTITTISVTHDLQEAFMMSDRIGILLDGTLCQYNDAKTVYNEPVSSRVATFLGHVNSIPAHSLSYFGISDDSKSGSMGISVRAESIRLTKDDNGQGIVEDVIFAGHYIIYRVRVNDVTLTVYSLNSNLEVEEKVGVTIKHFMRIKET
ncbi:MAG: ABC transporter ATP-binding protein [Deltaproteobacteria bacterium]|nr:ABC transporter ATP-binding protein [Deltaproteobacteria bacterium]